MDRLKRPSGLDPAVFWPAVAVAGGFVLWGTLGPDSLATVAGAVLGFIIDGFGWTFVVSTAVFLAFALFLAMSRFGHIKLGHDDDEPEFTHRLLGLHDVQRRHGHRADVLGRRRADLALRQLRRTASPPPESREAALLAMQYSYFHWALHPWAIYAVTGLAIAYFSYRKGMPVLISSAFTPLLGDKARGPIGKAIDTLAIIATLFGTATSLGLGAQQINSGLNFLWGTGESNVIALTIIGVLTVAVHPLGGLRRRQGHPVPVSNINMVLAVVLLVFLGVRRPDHLHHEHLPGGARRLPQQPRQHVVQAPPPSATAKWLDRAGRSSTGPGGFQLGALRRRLHRPHLARPHDPRVRDRRAADPERRDLHLVHRHGRRRAPLGARSAPAASSRR